MKKFISQVVLLLLLTIGGCKNSDKALCSEFKVGKYYLHSKYNGWDYVIDRRDSFQIETSRTTGLISKWKINWINDCEYETIFTKENYGSNTTDPNKIVFKNIKYKILEATDKFYIYSTKIDSVEITDTLWRNAKH